MQIFFVAGSLIVEMHVPDVMSLYVQIYQTDCRADTSAKENLFGPINISTSTFDQFSRQVVLDEIFIGPNKLPKVCRGASPPIMIRFYLFRNKRRNSNCAGICFGEHRAAAP